MRHVKNCGIFFSSIFIILFCANAHEQGKQVLVLRSATPGAEERYFFIGSRVCVIRPSTPPAAFGQKIVKPLASQLGTDLVRPHLPDSDDEDDKSVRSKARNKGKRFIQFRTVRE